MEAQEIWRVELPLSSLLLAVAVALMAASVTDILRLPHGAWQKSRVRKWLALLIVFIPFLGAVWYWFVLVPRLGGVNARAVLTTGIGRDSDVERTGSTFEFTLDREADATYLDLGNPILDPPRSIFLEGHSLDADLIIDVDSNQKIVGVEILGASVVLHDNVLNRAERID